jgi:hypothetical protein
MGFKKTSEPLNIGATLDLVDGTPAFTQVTLPLSSLDREIFVVTDVQMDAERLNVPAAVGSVTLNASVNKTDTGLPLEINNPNCISSMQRSIGVTAAPAAIYQEAFSPNESSTGSHTDYIAVIATPNFVVSGSFATTAGGQPNRAVFVRLTGYRARADADLYAALVTEEVNQ